MCRAAPGSHQKAHQGSVRVLLPRGRAPLTEAVKTAAERLGVREHISTAILVSDGIESCKADPCALAVDHDPSPYFGQAAAAEHRLDIGADTQLWKLKTSQHNEPKSGFGEPGAVHGASFVRPKPLRPARHRAPKVPSSRGGHLRSPCLRGNAARPGGARNRGFLRKQVAQSLGSLDLPMRRGVCLRTWLHPFQRSVHVRALVDAQAAAAAPAWRRGIGCTLADFGGAPPTRRLRGPGSSAADPLSPAVRALPGGARTIVHVPPAARRSRRRPRGRLAAQDGAQVCSSIDPSSRGICVLPPSDTATSGRPVSCPCRTCSEALRTLDAVARLDLV